MHKLIAASLLWCCCIIANAQLKGLQFCKAQPSFIVRTKFNTSKTALSTSEKKYTGLVVVEIPDANKPAKYYQDSTWKKFGYLGSFTLDEQGNVYALPTPNISVLQNPKHLQNTILKINAISGKMQPWFALPSPANYNPENPFGLLGIVYDCTTKVLYVSTVSASAANSVKGKIYAVDTKSVKPLLIDSLQNIDAIGLGAIKPNIKEKMLLIGDARNSNVYSIRIDSAGKFLDKEYKFLLSIAGLGPRGDDKAKKIDVSDMGEIVIKAVEFNFNLIAPTEAQQGIYKIRYNNLKRKFEVTDIQFLDGIEEF